MRYLAIDTAGSAVEILIKYDDKVLFRKESDNRRASECLLTMLDEMLDELNLTLSNFDYYAVVVGPGSFTGIRIGINTIKTFALVHDRPVIAITSLDKLAYNYNNEAELVVCITDAYANFCYIAVYDSARNIVTAPTVMIKDEVLPFVNSLDTSYVVFAGENLADIILSDDINNEKSFMDAIERFINDDKGKNYRKIEPFYIVKSQAEREKENKNDHN